MKASTKKAEAEKGKTGEKQDESPAEKAKKQKKLEKQIIVLFIVLALAFLSFLAAYEVFKPKPYFDYFGLKIYKAKVPGVDEKFYMIPLKGTEGIAQIMLRNDPRTMNVSVRADNFFSEPRAIDEIWITMPPELKSGAVVAGNTLGRSADLMNYNVNYALTESDTNYTVRTCEDATNRSKVFMLDLGNETKVYEDGNCVLLEGEDYEGLVKAADALVVKWILKLRLKTS